jgi:hypothetical protein
MSWLALLLIGIGVTDLAFSVRPARIVPECIGALAALAIGLGCGLTATRDVIALVVIAAVVVAWGQTVTRGFARGGQPWIPLALLGLALGGAVAAAPGAGQADGLLGEWLGRNPLPVLAGVDPDRFLLLTGLVLVQLSTGNVLVRLVLAVTGTMSPAQHGTTGDPEMRLKGGRLLGPMGAAGDPRPRARRRVDGRRDSDRGQGPAPVPRAAVTQRAGADPPADGVLPGRQLRQLADPR